MPDTLPVLIDKLDGFELVRDQVAVILAENTTAQQALAVLAGKPAADWTFRVFTERSRPWESFRTGEVLFNPPIVNVSYQGDEFPGDKGDTIERQAAEGKISIDCYGLGQAQDVSGGGYAPGDRDAVAEAQRCVRLVRNILMAAQNAWLQLRATDVGPTGPAVWQRWVSGRQFFEPDLQGSALSVVGFQLVLDVTFNEYAPQFVGQPLEYISVGITRNEDGAVLGGADFDLTV